MIEQKKELTLIELESEVLAEGRERTRQRLQQRLQALAEPPKAMRSVLKSAGHG
jgi:hypothetical protein